MMRKVWIGAAVIVASSLVHVDGISMVPMAAQDRVATVLGAARKAMGGEDKIAGVKTLTAEGPFRRTMGPRDMEGTASVTLARPDKFKRVEEMQMGGMVGGPSIERTSVLSGNTAWDDTANRGGMGGGMQIMIREAPGPGAGPGGAQAPTPEQLNEARVRRMRVQMQRLMAAILADAGTPWVDAGVAESPDGKADILETKEETGRALRLFIDQSSHLPLMVQYQDPKPMVMIQGGPGRGPGGPGRGPGGPPPGGAPPSTEEIQKRVEEARSRPPQMGTFEMHLGDYKKVDGVMLPHKIETSLDGEPNEEWTIEKYKVNPQIKPDTWEKK
jgi:hypothetical protein